MKSALRKIVLINTALLWALTFLAQAGDWRQLAFPQGARINQIAFNSRGHIFLNTWWYPVDSLLMDAEINRIERSTDQGGSWQTIFNYAWPSFSMAIDSADNIYASKFEKVFKSTDNGASWQQLQATMPGVDVDGIAISPKGWIFIGSGPYRSLDTGKHWQSLSLKTYVLQFAFLSDGSILAGAITGFGRHPSQAIFRSTDDGDTWNNVFNADSTYDWSIVQDCQGIVYAATCGFSPRFGGVYKSVDHGVNWTRISDSLQPGGFNSIAVNSLGHIVVGNNQVGVFRSTNQGNNWNNVTSDLPDLRIQCLTVNNDNLYLGTGTSGFPTATTPKAAVYIRSTLTSVLDEGSEIPVAFDLKQNYPNPFNPVTRISYSVPRSMEVTITIHDLLGRSVCTLLDHRLVQRGSYEAVFNASVFPSGTYFCTMHAGTKSRTTKLLLVK